MNLLELKEGRAVGDALNAIMQKVIDGELPNERVKLVEYLITGEWRSSSGK